MRARLIAFALPLVLLACKKEAPAPLPAGSASAASPSASAATPATTGESLAILKDFEGKIGWVVKGKLAGLAKDGGAPLNLDLLVKDSRFRLDLPAGFPGAHPTGTSYLLGRPQEKKFFAVIDALKQAMLIDAEKLGSQLDLAGGKGSGPAAGDDAPSVKKTGKLDKVVGYACEIWQVDYKASKMELCIAAESTAWLALPLPKIPPKYAWASELTDGKHFPLRFIAFDKSGAEEGRVELTGIEKKKLDAKSFEVPAGYQVVDLEQMLAGAMRGLSGAHGRPGTPSLTGLPGMPGTPVRPPPQAGEKTDAAAKQKPGAASTKKP